MLRDFWEQLRARRQADVRNFQEQRLPFSHLPISEQARSTIFDPEQGLHTRTQRMLYIFDCGHITAQPVGAGRCYICGRWVCAQCLSKCASCGALICNLHSLKADFHFDLCPSCAEGMEEKVFFAKVFQLVKAILVFPFRE